MSKWKKRVLSVFLAVFTVFAVLPTFIVPAAAETAFSGAVAGSSPSITYTLTYSKSRPDNSHMKYDFTLKATMSNGGHLDNHRLTGKVTVNGTTSSDINICSLGTPWKESSTPTKTFTFSVTCSSTTGNASQSGSFVVTGTTSSSGLISKSFTVTSSPLLIWTVTYNANGGNVSPTSATVNRGSSLTTPTPTRSCTLTYNPNGGTVSPTSESRTFIFNGWYTAASGGTKRANPYPPSKDETIYAQWTNPTMGAGGVSLPTPTRSGYYFTGWFTAASGGTQVTSSTTMTGSQTIYAQWTDIPFTIQALDGEIIDKNKINYKLRLSVQQGAPLVVEAGFNVYVWNGVDFSTLYLTRYWTNEAGIGGSDWSWPLNDALPSNFYEVRAYAKNAAGVIKESENQWGWFHIEADEYPITYNANGGSGAPSAQAKYKDVPLTLRSETPSRTGYKFANWKASNGSTYTPSANYSANEATTLAAQWTPNSFIIKYNANGGNGSLGDQLVYYDQGFTMPIGGSFWKTGYTLTGWSRNPGTPNTKHYEKNTTYAVSMLTDASNFNCADTNGATMTLYPVWTPNHYTVTFEVGGGVNPPTRDVIYGEPYGSLPIPFRTGYTFDGWYTAPDGTGTQVTSITIVSIAGNHTLYAKYTAKTYTVSFNAHGGTGGQTANVTATYDLAMPTINTTPPTRSGYNFGGWYDTSALTGGTQYYTAEGTSARTWDKDSSPTTLYARWLEPDKYNITFDKRGGSGGTDDVIATYDAAMPEATMPTRKGYTFEGYFDAISGGIQYYTSDGASTRTWDKSKNDTLYARWSAINYTVSFNANGGTGGQTADVIANYDASMPSISTTPPTRTGYTFGGWYDTSASIGGTQYYSAAGASARTWDKDSNATLYARWTANTYTIKYNANGGSGIIGDQVVTFDQNPNPTLSDGSAFSRTEYTLMGWSRNSGAANTKHYDKNTAYAVSTLTNASNFNCANSNGAAMNLYAVWTLNTYALTVSEGTGGGNYAAGANVTITANDAPTGKVFDKWTKTAGTLVNENSKTTTFIMPASSATVTATYKDIVYALTVIDGTGGGNYAAGAKVNIKANPAPNGWAFDKWTVTAGSLTNQKEANTTFTMPAGVATVTASYKKVFSGFSLQNDSSNSSNKTYKDFLLPRDETLLMECAGRVGNDALNPLQAEISKKSYGLCYGMSAAAVLDYYGDIAFAKNFALGEEVLSTVQRSGKVESAIAFHQLLSVVPSVHTNRLEQVSFSATSDPAPRRLGMKKLIDNAENGEPTIAKIVYAGTPPHMIVITGCKERNTDGSAILSAYDCNNPKIETIVSIGENGDSVQIDGYPGITYLKMQYDLSGFADFDIDGKLNNINNYVPNSSAFYGTTSAFLHVYPNQNFTVKNNSGETATYNTETGTFSGSLEIISWDIVPGAVGNGITPMILEVAKSPSFTFLSSNGINASVTYNGVYGAVSSDNADSATITNQGVVTVNGGNSMTYTATVGVNNGDMDIVQVSGTATEHVSVEPGVNGAVIDGVSNEVMAVTVVSELVERNTVNFTTDCDSVIVGKPNDVTVYGSIDGKTYTIDVLAGETAAALTEAKNAKIAAINAVTNDLNASDYTSESWHALQTAISNAIAQVNAATTIEAVNDVELPSTSDLVLGYVLTLNPNGGSVTPTTVTQAQSTTYTLPNPTRSGYTFTGWTLSGGGSLSGNTYTFGTSNGTVTAQWAANVTNYTVTYNADGGNPANIAPVTVASGTSITLPTAPTKSGNIFKGWKTGNTTLAAGASYTVVGNVTFTAQWAKTIFSTKYEATFLNWILFFVCFGFIWMWF